MKTKTKYLAFDETEFDTEKEVEEYEKTRKNLKNKYKVIWELNKIWRERHKNDNDEKEHCIFSGKLCNRYEQETSHHNGDYYRGGLKEALIPNCELFRACMTEEKARLFLDGLKKLVEELTDE